MAYSHKTHEIYGASISASIVLDEADTAAAGHIVEKTEDFGECPFCSATIYYCMDHTHTGDCPTALVSEMHDRFQDALILLDDAIAKHMIETGRGGKLREHPLDTLAQAVYDLATKASS